ncbi:type I-C CRISPR-associated protein Cas8c/Csd1 [Deinococcus sp. YIM 77859]|uniref:type I-C CRISPR-associated protein Cas8c/Csd1 n=1 Tax=Deinococcus sp. YIM 77859 TaxID=1540221 RepID=UPI0005504E10|nr:type I-C CRISPR-associated protein Cas8c/Csd1 [Deinococcus sp. YIM 77859]
MLEALIRQAEQAGLSPEPGFARKELHWLAQLHGSRLTGVLPLREGKQGRSVARCPELSQPEMMALPKALGQTQAAHFLADSCGVIALLPERAGQEVDPKTAAKHLAYLALLERAARAVPELQPVLEVLRTPDQLNELRAELARQGAKATDRLSFAVDGLDLLESELWHPWWRGFRREVFGRAAPKGTMLDLSSGEAVTPAQTHLKLTRLGVGAMPTGASLVGYDKEAFGSYGLQAGENGAVSEENVAAYRAALDQLLDRAPVLGQMKVAVWFDHRQDEGEALIQALTNPTTLEQAANWSWDDWDDSAPTEVLDTPEQQEAVAKARAQQLLTALRRGEAPPALTARYFALAISGASGRAMVRDWHTGSLEHLAQAVTTWFEDLAIVNLSGQRAKRPGFSQVLLSIQRPKAASTSLDDYLKPIRNLQLPLWRAALDPQAPLPLAAVTKVMEAHRAQVMSGAFSEALSREGDSTEKARIYTRMALLRAYHCRKARRQLAREQGGFLMSSSVDPRHPSPAYHCGRLMYLLAQVQEAQGGDINAGVVQRYYGAASSTPGLVLGRLTRLSQHHLAKIARDKPGLAYTLEQDIAAVWAVLGHTLPRTLSLEEQSLFALGYYQQLADSVARRKELAAQRRAAQAN